MAGFAAVAAATDATDAATRTEADSTVIVAATSVSALNVETCASAAAVLSFSVSPCVPAAMASAFDGSDANPAGVGGLGVPAHVLYSAAASPSARVALLARCRVGRPAAVAQCERGGCQ